MKYSDYNEGKLHGTNEFPLEYYYVTPDNPQYIMSTHWHKEFEIIKVILGSFNLRLNNIGYTLTAGDIIFVECGTLHGGEPDNCVYECLVFDLNMLKRRQNDATTPLISPLIDGSKGINCVIPQKGSSVYSAASALFAVTSNRDDFYEIETYSLLFRLLSQLYKTESISSVSKNPQTTKKNQTVIKLLDWIDNNFTENITLQKLSEISNLSEKYICRVFKEYTSKTPINYINELRIDAACHEMISDKKSVTEAALACGFNDLSYFSKLFKRYKHISPYKYRRNYL